MTPWEGALLVPRNKAIQHLITTYSIVLLGRNRHLRVTLFFNRISNCRASGSTITHLPSFLRCKFGETAVGLKVGDSIFRNDEELMRDGTLNTDDSYYVVYEDYTPSYSCSIIEPPIYSNEVSCLPSYDRDRGYLKPLYFEELVYYPVIPTVQKTLILRLKYGRRAKITLNNKSTEWQNTLKHEIMVKAGYTAQGVVFNGQRYYSDDVLWADTVPDESLVDVTYTPPPTTVTRTVTRTNTARRRVSVSSSIIHRVTSRSSRPSHEIQAK